MDSTSPCKPVLPDPSDARPAATGATLFDRMGGEPALMAAVDIFYQRLLADPLTRPFFANLNIAAQVKKQVGFMSRAFGGPEEYRGRDLRATHARLVRQGLSDQHFDAVAGHLEATLVELGVAPGLIQEALAVVATTRTEVLNR
jgi:hemoglobin